MLATMGHWDGPVRQHGDPCAGRYRLGTWLHDGGRIVAVSDEEGRETLTVHDVTGANAPQRLDGVDLSSHCPHGRPVLLRMPLGEIERRFGRA
jgi:hypothetical protein